MNILYTILKHILKIWISTRLNQTYFPKPRKAFNLTFHFSKPYSIFELCPQQELLPSYFITKDTHRVLMSELTCCDSHCHHKAPILEKNEFQKLSWLYIFRHALCPSYTIHYPWWNVQMFAHFVCGNGHRSRAVLGKIGGVSDDEF